jgi:RimJ/RimL family protein N-acetyltransferase
MDTVRSARLTLVPQVAAHAEEMFVVLCDPAIYEYENRPPQSLEWLRTRFIKLETRRSSDGREQWLNWVIRLPTSELIGYVQATVKGDGSAAIAYELCSAYWRRGLASEAVRAMIAELVRNHGVRSLVAVFKRENRRSFRLLESLGFLIASPELHTEHRVEPDEILMLRAVASPG